jgi:AhpD family alkylhydroperoxidase
VDIYSRLEKRQEYKRKADLASLYRALLYSPRAAAAVMGSRRRGEPSPQFIERVMLAVTEVNGCAACSYAHARMALREGLSPEEIVGFLSGDSGFTAEHEAYGILFAQHYAESGGYPDREAYERLVAAYGDRGARVILSAAQVMTAGNMVGIPFSALASRLRGRPYRESTLVYELGMQLLVPLLMIPAVLHSLVRWAAGRPNVKFSEAA